jgi:hypothetical protein
MRNLFIVLLLAVFLRQAMPAFAKDWIMFDQNYYSGESGDVVDNKGVYVDIDSIELEKDGLYYFVVKTSEDSYEQRINCSNRTTDGYDWFTDEWTPIKYPHEVLMNIVCNRQKK